MLGTTITNDEDAAWWVRTPNRWNTLALCYVDTDGTLRCNEDDNWQAGFAPAFAIGKSSYSESRI
jgi:hypothetical protein